MNSRENENKIFKKNRTIAFCAVFALFLGMAYVFAYHPGDSDAAPLIKARGGGSSGSVDTTITYKQSQAASASHSNTVSQSITPIAANNVLIVSCETSDINTNATIDISDDSGGAYIWNVLNPLFHNTNVGGGTAATWWAYAPNTTTVTITCTNGGSVNFETILIDEFSGIKLSSPVDQTITGTGSGNIACPSQALTADNELVWGAGFSVGGVSAVGSGYSKAGDDANGDWTEYKVLSGGNGSSQSITFTASGEYLCVMGTFKPISSSGGTAPSVKIRGGGSSGGVKFR